MAVFMRKIYMLIATCFRLVYLRVTRGKRKVIDNGKILYVLSGGVGDVTICASAIFAIIDYFRSQGKTVYIYCTRMTKTAMGLYSANMGLLFIERNNQHELKAEIRKISSATGGIDFEKIIVWGGGFQVFSLAANLNANEKYGDFVSESNLRYVSLTKKCVDYQYCFSVKNHEAQSINGFVHFLGISDYNYRFLPIPKQANYTPPFSRYATVTVDSAISQRRWNSKNFIDLIYALLEKYGINICVVGTNVEPAIINEYENEFGNDQRCRLLIKSLTIGEWIELIRGSSFHIGVDSGSIHIAAAVGTQAFCLTGVWDGHVAIPYPDMMDGPGIIKPIGIYRSDVDVERLPCKNCNSSMGAYGGIDKECRTRCDAGEPCVCLARIGVEDVLRAVDHYMQRGE